MNTTYTASEARTKLPDLLDRAEKGKNSLIIRNSKTVAAIVPAQFASIAPLVAAVLRELGESLEMSIDPDVIEAFRRGQDELERGELIWDEF
jgi:prevent-host-death family protein